MSFLKNILIIFIISSAAYLSSAKELTLLGNYVKLTVKESGGFNLYARNSVNDPWTALLYEEKVSANYIRFFSENKKIPFGEGGLDRFADIFIKDNRINYIWYDKKYRIELLYELTTIDNSEHADALIIDIKVKNNYPLNINLDFFFCFDTYLGERSKEHFILEENFIINRESKVETPDNLRKISSLDKTKNLGIDFIFGDPDQIPPSLVYFANWKKVERITGLYSPVDGLFFDNLPNSINDSALFVEFVNQSVESKNELNYRFILKVKNQIVKDDKLKVKLKDLKKEKSPDTSTSNAGAKKSDFSEAKEISSLDIKDLLELLDKINQKLDSGESLKEDEVDLFNKVLIEIKRKRSK